MLKPVGVSLLKKIMMINIYAGNYTLFHWFKTGIVSSFRDSFFHSKFRKKWSSLMLSLNVKRNYCLRPYHPERAWSRLISEAKQGRAWLVLGWEKLFKQRTERVPSYLETIKKRKKQKQKQTFKLWTWYF